MTCLLTDGEEFIKIQRDDGNWIPGHDDVVSSLDESARYRKCWHHVHALASRVLGGASLIQLASEQLSVCHLGRNLVSELGRISVASLQGEAALRTQGPYRLPGRYRVGLPIEEGPC